MQTNSKVGKQHRRDERMIAGTKIHVGQLQWGLQTIRSWSNAVQAAESVYNARRKPLYDFYNNIEKDPHLDSLMDKRTRAVKTSEFVWENVENEALRRELESPWFMDLLGQIMSRVYYGYTLINFKTNHLGRLITEIVPRQNVNPELGLITTEMYGNTGLPYRSGRYTKKILEIGTPEQLGKLSRVGPYVLMKKDNMVWYAYHNQLEGNPMKIYYYDPGNLTQRKEVEQQAAVQGAASYLVLPRMASGKSVDVVETNRAGASSAFKDFHGICNEEMSISIVGQNLTTSNGDKGTHALGRVHQAVEEAVNLEDMLTCEYIINYDVSRYLRALGFPIPEEGLKGHFKKTERMGKLQKAQMFAIAAQHTLVKDEVWQEELGIDPPTPAELKKWREGRQTPINANASDPQPKHSDEDDEEEKENTPPDGGDGGGQKKKTKPSGLSASLNSLYFSGHHAPLSGELLRGTISASYEDDLSRIWNQIMNGIWNGTIKPGDTDQELFELVAKELFAEVEKGFGASLASIGAGTPDEILLKALRENVYLFSGFKNYQTLKAATELLVDADGVKRSFNDFKELALKINSEYNINYLFAEYQNANAQAQMASKWLQFQADKDALPYIEVDVVMDDRTRHEKYNKIRLPVDHPFWDAGGLPPYDWGCRCGARQYSDGPISKDLPDLSLLKDEFQFNPGKDKVIFPKNHPYYKVDARDTDRRNSLFGLKIPQL